MNTNTNAAPVKKPIVPALDENGNPILCEKCDRPMMIRENSKDGKKFMGCSGYPSACKHTKPLPVVSKGVVTPGHEADIAAMGAPEKAEPHPSSNEPDAFKAIFGDQEA